MKNIKRTLRKWHKWIGVILSIVIGIVAVTAIFLAHRDALNFEKITVNVNWLPGYKTYATKMERMEVKCCLSTREGEWLLGTKSGLFVITEDKLITVDQLQNMDVRNIVKNRNDIFVAGKSGVWMLHENSWNQIYKGDVHSVTVSDRGEIIVASKEGLRISNDNGKHWDETVSLNTMLATVPPVKQNISLHKLIADLHTGKAFFGKSLEWIWVDALGLTVIFLTVSGVYLWWK